MKKVIPKIMAPIFNFGAIILFITGRQLIATGLWVIAVSFGLLDAQILIKRASGEG